MRLSLSAQLAFVFALISAASTFALQANNIVQMKNMATTVLNEKSAIVTRNLASLLSTPVAKDAARVAPTCETIFKEDPDILYTYVLTPEGKVLYSSDPALKGETLARDSWEKDALRIDDYRKRRIKDADDAIESVMPIMTGGTKSGVLRLGVSAKRYDSTVLNTALMGTLIGVVAMVFGVFVFKSLGNQIELSGSKR